MMSELYKKVDALMGELIGNENKRHSSHTIRVLFNLHNEATGINEYSVGCASCRRRVYLRLKDWWLNEKEKIEHKPKKTKSNGRKKDTHK